MFKIKNRELSNNDILKEITKAAINYSNFCGKDMIYIKIDKNTSNLFTLKMKCLDENFQHLCGIRSETLSPSDFYKNSLESKISIKDCTPATGHNMGDISEKVSILSELLDFRNMGSFKCAKKITGNIDFDYGVGQEYFIGYKYAKLEKAYVPKTNITSSINKFCSNPVSISLVLSKEFDEKLFSKIEYEAFKNLLSKIDNKAFEQLSPLLDESLYPESRRESRTIKVDCDENDWADETHAR